LVVSSGTRRGKTKKLGAHLALRSSVLEQRSDAGESSTKRVGQVTEESSSDGQGHKLGERILSKDGVLDGAESLESVSGDAGRLVVEAIRDQRSATERTWVR
jgi:hypothetical protein